MLLCVTAVPVRGCCVCQIRAGVHLLRVLCPPSPAVTIEDPPESVFSCGLCPCQLTGDRGCGLGWLRAQFGVLHFRPSRLFLSREGLFL